MTMNNLNLKLFYFMPNVGVFVGLVFAFLAVVNKKNTKTFLLT